MVISHHRGDHQSHPQDHSNWKAAGCNGVANFWLKQLTSVHPKLANEYNKILKNLEHSPE